MRLRARTSGLLSRVGYVFAAELNVSKRRQLDRKELPFMQSLLDI
jgi:hypothetical protein